MSFEWKSRSAQTNPPTPPAIAAAAAVADRGPVQWLAAGLLLAGLLLAVACAPSAGGDAAAPAAAGQATPAARAEPVPEGAERALFAGGCFWCMEGPFDELPGVISTTSGYTGGRVEEPTYEQVSAGRTGHAEAVEVLYDPEQISYQELLHVFWRNIDPLAENRQFCDRGSQYRSAVFYLDEEQKRLAEASKRELEASGRFDSPVVTEIVAGGAFYPAEEYHQDFYRKNPGRYQSYRTGCGRDRRLAELWGDEAGGGH